MERGFRALAVIDEWSRESLAIEVDRSLTGERVTPRHPWSAPKPWRRLLDIGSDRDRLDLLKFQSPVVCPVEELLYRVRKKLCQRNERGERETLKDR
jgi:hypothetical protein